MKKLLQEYLALVKQLVDLRKQLVSAFESTVQIQSINDIIQPKRTISAIIKDLHQDVDLLINFSMSDWVKPEAGVIHLEGSNWSFQLHDSIGTSVEFFELHPKLALEDLEALKRSRMDVWFKTARENNPDEVSFLYYTSIIYDKGGQADWFNCWEVKNYARRIGSKFSILDGDEHKNLLQNLVSEKRPGIFSLTPEVRIKEADEDLQQVIEDILSGIKVKAI